MRCAKLRKGPVLQPSPESIWRVRFLSPEQAGAQAPEALKAPVEADWRSLFDRWKGIRMVGAAPELPGALDMGDWLTGRGITASIAHSNAFEPEMRKAVEHGFSDVTQPVFRLLHIHSQKWLSSAGAWWNVHWRGTN